ncbi:MAG: hypothetical protein ABI723_07910 [Bacteroidia bacterium]
MKKKIIIHNTRKNRSFAKQQNSKTHPRYVIILMSMPTPIHAVTAVLDMPGDYNGRRDRAAEVILGCTANAYVTISAPVIATANANLAAYIASISGPVRDVNYVPLHNGLKSFMSLFQNAANADIANAIVIIESGGFRVKQMTINQKHEFKAEHGLMPGDVSLTAEGGPAHSVHNWNYSPDGIAWTRLRGTSAAHTHLDGLAIGDEAYFTHELSIHDVPQGVSQVFQITVN